MAETKYPAKLIYRFGHFEAIPEAGELYRRGQRVRIQELPFRMLVILLEQEGQVVSREALAKQLWPENIFVDFDQGLSTAVAKLRQALGDVAENPRFIQTVPRRGYRFIGPVTQEGFAPAESAAPEASAATTLEAAAPQRRLARVWQWLVVAFLLLSAGAGWFLLRAPSRSKAALHANDRVVLADFENATGNAVFDDTLMSALRVKLDESPYLRLVPAKAVRTALEQDGAANTGRLSPKDAQRVCQVLHAQAVVHGSVSPLREGFRLRLAATLCDGGEMLAEEEAFSPSTDALLFTLGGTADRLRRGLGEPESSVQRFGTPMVQATTASFSALQAFAAGEKKRASGQDHETIADYKLATDLDPEFALAYARLGTIYINENEAELSRAFYQKAFDLRMHTTERERLYLTAHYYGSAVGDVYRAIEVYKLWRQLYPEDLVAPNNLADSYETLGQPEQARFMAREALRIDPDNAFPYATLLQADQRLGRYDEARSVWREAAARKLDNSVISRMAMFRIGVATGDAALIHQQVEWAASNPREGELLMLQGWVAAAAGRLHEAQALFHQAQGIALSNGLKEFAADAGLDLAQFEADFGETREARAEVARSLKLAPGELNVKAFAAMILAGAGDAKQAVALADEVRSAAPQSTVYMRMILPMAQARLSLASGHAEAALEQLRPVAPYELSRVTELASIYDRAQALLAARRGADAAKEFARLEQLRAVCPISPYLALAHLGLARSRRQAGDREGSRAEYAAFLERWKDADASLPVLRQARVESRTP